MPVTETMNSALAARLDQAHREANQPLTHAEVAEILTEILSSMDGDVSITDLKIYQELNLIIQAIQTARSEIAAIRPDEIQDAFIPTATDELDAVVGATEEAAGRILDAAEKIQTVAEQVGEPHQATIFELVTEIFEASNFQDITGQRITKVVSTLKVIEEKINALVTILGDEVKRAAATDQPEAANDGPASDKDLLNGPQLPSNAIDQDEIDKLLSSFD
ncbi:MAG: protein phosphatase CheZ [Inquilinaceae bacterium]